jgi:hypothetical protein
MTLARQFRLAAQRLWANPPSLLVPLGDREAHSLLRWKMIEMVTITIEHLSPLPGRRQKIGFRYAPSAAFYPLRRAQIFGSRPDGCTEHTRRRRMRWAWQSRHFGLERNEQNGNIGPPDRGYLTS